MTQEVAIVLMHGLGASGDDLMPLADALSPKGDYRFIVPDAPVRAVTINDGMPMRAWYDITSIDIAREVDTDSVVESAELIAQLIERDAAHQFILMGFSQGGAMALYLALSHRIEKTIIGACCLSGYLLQPPPAAPANPIPIFLGHGSLDDLVPPILGRAAAQTIGECGHTLTHREYPIAHSISEAEVADVDTWLRDVIPS